MNTIKPPLYCLICFILSLGCQQSNIESVDTSAGFILDGPNKNSNYTLGSNQAAELAVSFSNAFVKKDYNFMSKENFRDSMFFYPEKGLEKLVFDLDTGISLIKSMHAPYDSITRTIEEVIPLIPSYDNSLNKIMLSFSENRYKKDGSIETYRFFEQHYIQDNKIIGVRKWVQSE